MTATNIQLQLVGRIVLKIKMLYLVGLGLADETDITVKGLEVVKKAERVYLEAYTSILLVDKQKLVCIPRCSLFCNSLSHNFKGIFGLKDVLVDQ